MASAAPLSFVFLFLCCSVGGASADGGGWQSGHATFYGGADASGTMGKPDENNAGQKMLGEHSYLPLPGNVF